MKPGELLRKSPKPPEPQKDQHFLMDNDALDRIVKTAPNAETVLEIGAGIGNLTHKLIKKYPNVTVIEKDPEYIDFLEKLYPDIEIIHKDASGIDFSQIKFDACISNPPYSLSTPLLFELLPLRKPIVFTLQKELAERIIADPGTKEYGRLSVTTRHYSKPEIKGYISKTSFNPPPEVDTAIVSFTPSKPGYGEVDIEFFMDFTRAIFTQRRKTLKNAIKNTTHITGINEIDKVISALDNELAKKRPDNMTPEEIADASRSVNNA